MEPSTNGQDPVEANRTANPRRTPGREPVGIRTTRRITYAVMGVMLLATVVLAAVLINA